jgi:hypothetical protein
LNQEQMGWQGGTTMAVITISRQFGSGGEEIFVLLAKAELR